MIGLQQLADVFLNAPDDTEFKVGGDDFLHPPALGGRHVLLVASQQLPVFPGRIRGPSPAAVQVLSPAPPDLGDHLVRPCHHMPVIHGDGGLGQGLADGAAKLGGYVHRHQSGRAPIQSRTAWPRRPSTMSRIAPVSRSVNTIDHCSTRVSMPASSLRYRTRRKRCSSTPRRRTRRRSMPPARTAVLAGETHDGHPGHPGRGSDPGDGTQLSGQSRDDAGHEPAGQTRTPRDLIGYLHEGPPGTLRFQACQPPLPDAEFHRRSATLDVQDTVDRAGLDPRREYPAVGAGTFPFDNRTSPLCSIRSRLSKRVPSLPRPPRSWALPLGP